MQTSTAYQDSLVYHDYRKPPLRTILIHMHLSTRAILLALNIPIGKEHKMVKPCIPSTTPNVSSHASTIV